MPSSWLVNAFYVKAAKKASEVVFLQVTTMVALWTFKNFSFILSGGPVRSAESARPEKYRICVSDFSACT